jgi:nucleotide-binding universal stress UspA family protein
MNPILIALDESESSAEVLSAGVKIAKALQAPVVLFRAVTLPIEHGREEVVDPGALPEQLLGEARRDLEQRARQLSESAPPKAQVAIGIPWQAICEAGRGNDASLIVIGSHNYAVIDRLLGTTAAKVVNHADRSVLVVRPSA